MLGGTYEGPSYKVCSTTSQNSCHLDYSFYFLGYHHYTPATCWYVMRTYQGPSYKVCCITSRNSSHLDYSFYFWDTTIIHQQHFAMLPGPMKALVTRYAHETLLIYIILSIFGILLLYSSNLLLCYEGL